MAYLTHSRVQALRKRLMERAQVLLSELEVELHSGGLAVEQRERDTTEVAASITAAAAERDSAELHAIQRALARMRAGDYGLCATCGAELPFARLDAVPEAERCVECTSALERRSGRSSL